MIKKYLYLIIVMVFLNVSVSVHAKIDESKPVGKSTEKSNYVALKGGIYSPTSNNLKAFGTGFNGEIVFGHYFNRNFATELGVGYFQSSNSASGAVSSGSDYISGRC